MNDDSVSDFETCKLPLISLVPIMPCSCSKAVGRRRRANRTVTGRAQGSGRLDWRVACVTTLRKDIYIYIWHCRDGLYPTSAELNMPIAQVPAV
jgi:hypothetical protein